MHKPDPTSKQGPVRDQAMLPTAIMIDEREGPQGARPLHSLILSWPPLVIPPKECMKCCLDSQVCAFSGRLVVSIV